MHCNLVKLATEIQLMIIENLRRDEDIKAHAGKGIESYGENDEPVRIYHDLINWSSTSSYFRNLLAPEIFKSVKLVNDDKSGSSLNTVAASQHNVHVKELHFLGSALSDDHVEKAKYLDTQGILPRSAEYLDTQGILPRSVEKLICELQRFPRLERLSLKFYYKFESPIEETSNMGIFADQTSEQILEAEASVAWRALLSRTYSALASNKSPHFKNLEIKHLAWNDVSTFSNAAFHNFLGQMEQFTLSSHSKYNQIGWTPSFPRHHPTMLEKLDTYFFNHLANVTTLHIKDIRDNKKWGLDGKIHYPLTLRADQMPLLTTLRLDYIFASRKLVDFLVSHKDTLEQLTLCDCYALLRPGGTYWSQFFTSLFFACPTQLRRFELFGDGMSLLREQADDQLKEKEDQPIRRRLREEPRRLLFLYAMVEEEDQMLFYDWDDCFLEFMRGEDQSSWDRLMGLVEGNAKRAANGVNKGVDES